MRDEGRSFGVGFQERASNHLKLLRSKVVVVSIKVKAKGIYPEQVWVKETNESEPLTKRREIYILVKTRDWKTSWDQLLMATESCAH